MATSASVVGMALRALAAPAVFAARMYGARDVSTPEGVPQPQSTWTLAGKIALDELLFIGEFVAGPIIALGERGRVAEEVSTAVRLYDKRGWLAEPLRYHRTPPVLQDPEFRRARSRGVSYEHMRFESGYAPDAEEPGYQRWLSYTPNRTAHAWVVRHRGQPRPWVVCVHGYRMGSPVRDLSGFWVEWLHRALGLNVIIPVLPFHGPRKVGQRSGDGVLTGDFLDTVHAEAQALWDIRRVLSWVRSQGAPVVATWGLSLGGLTVGLLAALEKDLRCVIAGIPAACLLRLTEAQAPSAVFALARFAGLHWSDMELLLRVVSPLAVKPKVARDRLFMFAGTNDRLVSPEHVRDLWRHWGEPRLLWYEGGHVSYLWEEPVRTLVYEALAQSGVITPVEHSTAA